MPIITSFTLWRGVAVTLRFTLETAEDVTGWTTQFVLRREAGSTTALLTKAGATIDAVNGVFDVALTKAETLALSTGDYVFAFGRTNAGSEDLLTEGAVTVKYSVLYNS